MTRVSEKAKSGAGSVNTTAPATRRGPWCGQEPFESRHIVIGRALDGLDVDLTIDTFHRAHETVLLSGVR